MHKTIDFRQELENRASNVPELDLSNPAHADAARWACEWLDKVPKRWPPPVEQDAAPRPEGSETTPALPRVVARKLAVRALSSREGKGKLLRALFASRGVALCGHVDRRRKDAEPCDRAKGHKPPHNSGQVSDAYEDVDAEFHAICRHFPRLVLRLLELPGESSSRARAVEVVKEVAGAGA